MKAIILLLIAILPVYLIALYIYKKDKDKESKKLLTKLFVFGILSCIPALILEEIAVLIFGSTDGMSMFKLFIYVMVGVALIEESCKWFMVYKIAYNHKEFDHIYDAVVYCVFVSLGFAALENIFYVLGSGVVTGLVRAVSAIPSHACDAIFMANYFGLARIEHLKGNKDLEKKYIYLSIIIPTIIHGIYDFCLFSENLVLLLVFLMFVILVYTLSIKKVKRLANVKDSLIIDLGDHIECPKCHKIVAGNYCKYCGTKLSED